MKFVHYFFLPLSILITILIIYLIPQVHYQSIVEPKPKDILAADFYAEFTKNKDDFLFIDVQQPSGYATKHAEESLNIPINVLFDERKNLPKSGRKIVLICAGGRASGVAAMYLEHYGFFNVSRITGGTEAWEEAGLPTVKKIDQN